jgi:hypothetical protein
MSRDEIIGANPIVDFVRSRGHELSPAGQNFVTSGCSRYATQAWASSGDDLSGNAILVVPRL